MAVASENNLPIDPLGPRMADLLIGMVRGLADHPDAVRTDVDTAESNTTIKLYVAPDDLGKVIGKQGRTARALRTILNAVGSKAEHRVTLDVLKDGAEGEAVGA